MKRTIAAILAVLLMLSSMTAFAEATINIDEMTADELANLIEIAANRIATLKQNDEDYQVMFDNDGIRISLIQVDLNESRNEILLHLFIENNTDHDIQISMSNFVSINGWTVNVAYQGERTTQAHGKNKMLAFVLGQVTKYAEITSLDEVQIINVRVVIEAIGKPSIKTDYIHLVYSDSDGFIVVPDE